MIECPLTKWEEGGLKLKNGFWGLTLEGWRDQILSRGRGEGAIALECLIGVLPPVKTFSTVFHPGHSYFNPTTRTC